MASVLSELLGGGASQYKLTNESRRLGEVAILNAEQNSFSWCFIRGLQDNQRYDTNTGFVKFSSRSGGKLYTCYISISYVRIRV